jgi:hypothetical protein
LRLIAEGAWGKAPKNLSKRCLGQSSQEPFKKEKIRKNKYGGLPQQNIQNLNQHIYQPELRKEREKYSNGN